MYQIHDYLNAITREFKTGRAEEHSYRPHLKQLLEEIGKSKGVLAINEPRREKFGAPDFLISINGIEIGFVETKDIKVNRLNNLDEREQDQKQRYLDGAPNLIYTDYLEFIFYHNQQQVIGIKIAEFDGKTIVPIPENFELLTSYLNDFFIKKTSVIKSPIRLAELMAGKARLVADSIYSALQDNTEDNKTLWEQLESFRKVLIKTITEKEFADIYAQTIAYGMFVARLHDETLETFSRQEAGALIPKNVPFLRKMFEYIAGNDIDDRILWAVDSLANIFSYTDVADILKNFGRTTRTTDPIIHFYETFLSKYDKKLRKVRGVYYTPQPVVDYIVRSVDEILKTDFGLPEGLVDKSKITRKILTQGSNKPIEKEFHRVQVLDPATGTGTFLATTINFIHDKFANNQGIWPTYVNSDLLPRIHGFEIMMSSYSMAHLKLDLVLRETGYIQNEARINEQIFRQDDLFDGKLAEIKKHSTILNTTNRIGVYLTNALEEADPDTHTLWAAQWLSNEAKEANNIKQNIPVMCVIGNPPYSVSSSNNNDFAVSLIEKYKENLNERNIQPLSDDYIKFIALGQHYIDKNGSGILAYISNNSFLDGIIHRRMRKSLMETFDDIYILNLHGNTRRKETAPDGTKDENVFDIMQGVSINIFVKTQKKSKKLAEVYYKDLFGTRDYKYNFLTDHSLKDSGFNKLAPVEPYYFFTPKNFTAQKQYDTGFKVDEIFKLNTIGIQTGKDKTFISTNKFNSSNNQNISYRPFDDLYIDYDINRIQRSRYNVMKHILKKNNINLIVASKNRQISLGYIFVSRDLVDRHILDSAADSTSIFPLYTYFHDEKQSNLNPEIVRNIEQKIGSITPESIFDYIYGVLHSPSYRKKYREFLKIDFPRIPYPKDKADFEHYRKYGEQLRKLHLMQEIPESNVRFPINGTQIIEKIKYENARVYINKEQYFDNVPQTAWEFFIGGYQPAQKYLKDRRDRTLSHEEILHYEKIIAILLETDKIMKEIDTQPRQGE